MLMRIIRGLRKRGITLIGRRQLRRKGVVMGDVLHFHGLPIVSMAEGSSISLGDRVVLCSESESTALGVSRPVILRTLNPGARISIGDDVGLSGTVICAATRIEIGAECLIGADVQIVDTDFHSVAPQGRCHGNPDTQVLSAPVKIGRNVFIGAGVRVLKGVSIGDNSVIGAASVVTRDVPDNAVAAGNPARVIRLLDGPNDTIQAKKFNRNTLSR